MQHLFRCFVYVIFTSACILSCGFIKGNGYPSLKKDHLVDMPQSPTKDTADPMPNRAGLRSGAPKQQTDAQQRPEKQSLSPFPTTQGPPLMSPVQVQSAVKTHFILRYRPPIRVLFLPHVVSPPPPHS